VPEQVDEGLAPIPAMAQSCPWDGRPVPQPLSQVAAQYGALRGVERGQIFDGLVSIQKSGAHSHVGFHGRAVSSTIAPRDKSSIARGVQSVVHYDAGFHQLAPDGESCRFCVYSRPRPSTELCNDALAFAMSGAAVAPLQYFISGRQGSLFAPPELGQLRFHGLFYVCSWEWSRSADSLDGATGLRRDHCNTLEVTSDALGESSGCVGWHMYVSLQRHPPDEATRGKLRQMIVEHRPRLAALPTSLQRVDQLHAWWQQNSSPTERNV
jgi:hypothetical protein